MNRDELRERPIVHYDNIMRTNYNFTVLCCSSYCCFDYVRCATRINSNLKNGERCPVLPAREKKYYEVIIAHEHIEPCDYIVCAELARALTLRDYCAGMIMKTSGGWTSALIAKNTSCVRLYRRLEKIQTKIERLCRDLLLTPSERRAKEKTKRSELRENVVKHIYDDSELISIPDPEWIDEMRDDEDENENMNDGGV